MDTGGNIVEEGEHWSPQHRSKKYKPSQLAKLNPIEKSRYLFVSLYHRHN